MPNVRLKQMGGRSLTGSVFMGGDRRRRPLYAEEVVFIDEKFEMGMYAHGRKSLLETLLDGGKVELTHLPVTRPLDFPSERIARLTSPLFRPRGENDIRDRTEAEAAVEALLEQEQEDREAALTASQDEGGGSDPPEDMSPSQARAARRGRRRRTNHDDQATAAE